MMLPRSILDAARSRIADRLVMTPLLRSSALARETGASACHLKCEHLQKTGSFKTRGALNLMSQLTDDERARGVVTISAGNHAQAVAWAAAEAGVSATVVMPADASPTKAAGARRYGAEVILHGTVFEAFELVHQLERERGLTFVHPFDDERIVAGTATVGLELLEQLPSASVVVVPVGGGGLIAGVATAVHHLKPSARVIGVEPQGAAAMRKSLDGGAPAHLEAVDTIAHGLAPPMAGTLNYQIVKETVADVVTVTDDEILSALRFIVERTKQVVEPSGAAAVAALLTGKVRLGAKDEVAAILSGGNVGLEELAGYLGGTR
ncbi:MAG TPA: threonine/serine dehydratase [Gemmatimonadales bacterium]|jgi:threonine dehydratase